jgi:hypothetical protein
MKRLLIILALVLGGCTATSYVNVEHPVPGSPEADAAVQACTTPAMDGETVMAPGWGWDALGALVGAGGHLTDNACDRECIAARRDFAGCMAEDGWVRCDYEAPTWVCERKPS